MLNMLHRMLEFRLAHGMRFELLQESAAYLCQRSLRCWFVDVLVVKHTCYVCCIFPLGSVPLSRAARWRLGVRQRLCRHRHLLVILQVKQNVPQPQMQRRAPLSRISSVNVPRL